MGTYMALNPWSSSATYQSLKAYLIFPDLIYIKKS